MKKDNVIILLRTECAVTDIIFLRMINRVFGCHALTIDYSQTSFHKAREVCAEKKMKPVCFIVAHPIFPSSKRRIPSSYMYRAKESMFPRVPVLWLYSDRSKDRDLGTLPMKNISILGIENHNDPMSEIVKTLSELTGLHAQDTVISPNTTQLHADYHLEIIKNRTQSTLESLQRRLIRRGMFTRPNSPLA